MKKLIVLFVSVLAVTLFGGQLFAGETGVEDSFTAKQLIGLEVSGNAGEHVGRIRDINLDGTTGSINYFILGKSLLGIGEDTTVAVPPEALQIKKVGGSFTAILIVSELRLLGAPAMTVGESSEDYRVRLHEYYCASPELGQGSAGLNQC